MEKSGLGQLIQSSAQRASHVFVAALGLNLILLFQISFADFNAPQQIAVVTASSPRRLEVASQPGITATWSQDLGPNHQVGYLGGNFAGNNSSDIACIDVDDTDTPYAFVTKAPGRSGADQYSWNSSLRRSTNQLTFYFLSGDYNGDSKSDIAYLYIDAGADENDVRVKITYGPDGQLVTGDPSDWQLLGERNSAFIAADYRGSDGIDDIAAVSDAGAGNFTVRFYRGSNGVFNPADNWTIPSLAGDTPVSFRPGDFDGDGSQDIAAFFYRSSTQEYVAAIAFGPTGAVVQRWNLGTSQYISFLTADLNNDGRTDIAGIVEQAPTRSANIYYGTATRTPAFPVTWNMGSTASPSQAVLGGQYYFERITGRVLTESGQGLQPVTLDAGQFGSTSTSPDGSYEVSAVLNGAAYSLTPTYTGPGLGYRFQPVSVSDQMTGAAVHNFLALQNFDTDGDGTLDHIDTDDDDDGVSDIQEGQIGTNPLDPDSDDDGVDDGQELSDGTNPLDPGSLNPPLDAVQCSDWNGFLSMWNVKEHNYKTNRTILVQARLFDINGVMKGVQLFTIPPHGQFDLLVHDIPGFEEDSYGKICSVVIGGHAGDIDGRMSFYRIDDRIQQSPWDQRFDFAFAVPFSNGIKGSQVIPYNTFQPSLDNRDKNNLVANWVQISNLEQNYEAGWLVFYGADGSITRQIRVDLPGEGRRDFAAHQFGPNLVGFAEWQPDNPEAKFRVHNSRYYYDNPYGTNTFATALQFDGVIGNGQRLLAPLDTTGRTAVVEMSNTLAQPVVANVLIYDAAGQLKFAASPTIGAHATVHLIADPILNGQKGSVELNAGVPNSIVATSIQYTRTPSGGVGSIYAITAREALGSDLESNYNTYLNQACRLLLINQTSTVQGPAISMIQQGGTPVITGVTVSVPPHGLLDYDLCGNEVPNRIGIVQIQLPQTGSIMATVLRIGNHNDYQFSTPAR